MPIVRTGSVGSFDGGSANSNSTSVTVPADAEIMVVGIVMYPGDSAANAISNGTCTIGGAAMTVVPADANTSFIMGAIFYRVSPPTGTQTLAYDMQGTTNNAAGVGLGYAFYKGINLGTPVRDSDSVQAAQGSRPFTTPTLTCLTGDMIVAFGFVSAAAALTGSAWTGATLAADLFQAGASANASQASWGEGSPSGNQTVAWTYATNGDDGGCVAIVLQPVSALADPIPAINPFPPARFGPF